MAKRRTIAIIGLMAVVVFGAVPGFQAPDGHNFLAYYAIALLAVMALSIPWEIKAFATVAGASCFWLQFMVANVAPREAAVLFSRLYVSANCDFQYIVLFVLFYALVKRSRISMTAWLNFLAWAALIEIVRISLQRLGWDPIYTPVNISHSIADAAGSQGNVGWSGAMIAMCAPGFFRRGYWLGMIPVAGGLYLTHSMTPVIAVAGAFIVYAAFNFPLHRFLAGLMLALSASALMHALDPGDSARLANWARAWDLIQGRETWILGYGLGSWMFLFPEPGYLFERAHCEPLQVYFEMGFAGVVCLLLYGRFLVLRIYRSPEAVISDQSSVNSKTTLLHRSPTTDHRSRAFTDYRSLVSSGMVAVILCSLGNFPFHLAGTAILAVAWMAIFDLATTGGTAASRSM